MQRWWRDADGRRIPARIPREAVARPVDGTRSDGADFLVAGRLFARLWWHSNGVPCWELYYDADGRLVGREREYHESGRLRWETRHVAGQQHGLTRQWDERGRLLARTRFVRGTGLDLWYDGGRLAEVRELRDGLRHGVEQLWNADGTVWRETHLAAGLEHGIERRWNDRGRLARGYPRYWIRGERVPRRRYLRAQREDATLVPYREADDRPVRRRPRAT